MMRRKTTILDDERSQGGVKVAIVAGLCRRTMIECTNDIRQ